jgi:hypothetical protein
VATRLEKFEIYRGEDRHECNLLSMRVNALLTSQSFFLIAWVILYTNVLNLKNSDAQKVHLDDAGNLLRAIALVAILTALLIGAAIVIGCCVIRKWHDHGRALALETHSGGDDDIDGCYLKTRGLHQPDETRWYRRMLFRDWQHALSIDLLGLVLPLSFVIFWGVVLWKVNLSFPK